MDSPAAFADKAVMTNISQRRFPGMTLIELLLVVALIAIVGTSMMAIGRGYLVGNFLDNKTNELVSMLRTAQLNSLAGKEDSTWGVSVGGGEIRLFKGASYTARDAAFDTVFTIPSSISITNQEVVFSRVTGVPDSTPTFTVSGADQSRTVVVNALGVVDVN